MATQYKSKIPKWGKDLIKREAEKMSKPYICQECGESHDWNKPHPIVLKATKPGKFSKANNRKWKAAHKKVK